MMLFRTMVSALLLMSNISFTHAGDVLEATVSNEDKRYFVNLEVIINANAQRVYKILTDYNNLSKISDGITESNLVYSLSDNDHRVKVTTEACVTFFCKTIVQVQDVEQLPGMVIISTTIPDKSDVDYAHARWKVTDEDGLTRISFNADLKPSFWVPPLIGPPLIERTLRNEALSVIEGLEILAQQP